MSFMRNPNNVDQVDEWDELVMEIKQGVAETEYSLPPGLHSAVGNQEHSSGSHYSQSQEEPLPSGVWIGNYNSKGSFGQSYGPLTGNQFLGAGIITQNPAPSFGNPQALKHQLNLTSPAFQFGFSAEKIQEQLKQSVQQGPIDPQVPLEEDLPNEGQNEIKVEAKEHFQEELEQQIPPGLQKEQEGQQQQEPENKEEQSQPETQKEKENLDHQESENKSAWGKPLKKEIKENKKSQQLQKSDEKEVKKPAEEKKLSGNIVAVRDFKSQPEKAIVNNHKSENLEGKDIKEGNLQVSRTFEKESDQNKNQVSDKLPKTDKKATTKDDKNIEKARSQEVWENTKVKTTYQKPESKTNKLNNKNLKHSNTPFALLRMSESSEPSSQENPEDDIAENLDETQKQTKKKGQHNENKKKNKNKSNNKKGESLIDVPDEDKKDEPETPKVQVENEVPRKDNQQNEKGIKDDKDAESSDEEEKSHLDETIKAGTKKKKKKKKKQTNEVNDFDEEKVDPRKVSKQIEEGKQKEGTSKSFAQGGGKERSNKKEPLNERLLFVPPINYYNDLFKSMQVIAPVQGSKEMTKE